MTLRTQLQGMFSQYDALVGRIKSTGAQQVIDDPVKREWAEQEGFRPGYNPNADAVTWAPKPTPAYQQGHIRNFTASMSPERLIESYPAFQFKAEKLDPFVMEVINKTMSGEISTQRAKEILYQMALDTFEEAWQGGSITGASKDAGSAAEALEKASKTNRVAGE